MKHSFNFLLLACCLMPAVAQDSLDPIRIPEETTRKLRIHTVRPVLPAGSETLVPATVALDAVINKEGSVESLEILSGHPMLAPAAVEAARKWRYRRYELNGIPRAVETTIHVEFSSESDTGNDTSAAVESPVFLTVDDVPAQTIYRVAPTYPPLARQARIQGTVTVRITINDVGEVRDTQLISGHPMLAPAALDAIKKWRYMPYEIEGRTVEIQTDVQVTFRLDGA